MGLRTGLVNRASLTSVTTDNYVKSGFGNINGALWLSGYNTALNTIEPHAGLSLGVSDGTRQWLDVSSRLDGLGTIDANRSLSTVNCMRSLTVAGATLAQANDQGAVTDGRQLNWNDADNAARLTSSWLIAVDNVHADTVLISGIDSPVDITAPGFEPNVVIFSATLGGGTAVNALQSIGFATWDGTTLRQCAIAVSEADGLAASSPDIRIYSNRCCGGVFSGANLIEYEASDFDSNGFSIIPRVLNTSITIHYVAIQLTGNNVWCGVVDTPTSTGETSHTDPGFRPQFLMQLQSTAESVDTTITGNQAGSYGIGTTNAVESRNFSCTDENGATTSNTSGIVSDRFVSLVNDTQTDSVFGPLVSMDGLGWTVNYQNLIGSSPAVLKWPTLVIGQNINTGMLQLILGNRII